MAVVTIDAERYKALWCARCGTQGLLEENSSFGELDCECLLAGRKPVPDIWQCWLIVTSLGGRRCFQRGRIYRVGAATYNRG